jgi:hypothetical protein
MKKYSNQTLDTITQFLCTLAFIKRKDGQFSQARYNPSSFSQYLLFASETSTQPTTKLVAIA